ncbi:hypothetical protein TIFTF001_006133 [Ficus carica]|uniref:Cytochrome b561 and DOMON domain-containing protein n=1 Tax=Ficus carica TaxID=3494 RepID=A0AA87ZLF7_FICCA|nr:hypothetical protein TIFTF001_006133 [Ficus carica]
MDKIPKLLLLLCVFTTLLFPYSSAQTCRSNALTSNGQFKSCSDLPVLNSFLHWTYDSSTGTLEMAYRHTGVSASTWVAWAINPSSPSMVGSQALVATPPSGGNTARAYTSPINGYQTTLAEGNLTYNVTGLSATYQNEEMTIYGTWTLPSGMTTINQVWQAGPISGSTLSIHSTASDNLNSKGTLDLLSGASQSGGGNPRQRRKNVHGVINAVSWGILLPIGASIARHLKVFKSADPAWFYLHVTCQTSAYIVGVVGWGTGLKLGSDSAGIKYNTHRNIGIALFCLGTLQVFALLLRPKKDHKYRLYWNIYHHLTGYTVIILSIVNVYKGLDILKPDGVWKRAYTGVSIAIAAVSISMEAYTWYVVLKTKSSERKAVHGMNGAAINGVNGHGSRPHHEV